MTLTVSMKAAAIGITNEGAGPGPFCWESGAFIIGGVGEPGGGVWYSDGGVTRGIRGNAASRRYLQYLHGVVSEK